MKKLQHLQLAKTDNKQLNENMFVLVQYAGYFVKSSHR